MNKNPVNGMRDILPKEMKLRTYVLSVIRKTYRSFGFTEVETPVVESIENLTGKNGGENEKLTFQIVKRGEKLKLETAKTALDLVDSGLRYDLTMPLSRYYSCHFSELPKPFKALQIGPVFRAERPQKGRYREFYQCDIDILGEPANLAETELILATSTALSNLGFKEIVIRLNDRRILKDMVEKAGLNPATCDDVFITLDKMDKIGEAGVRNELLSGGVPEEAADKLLRYFSKEETASAMEALARFEKTVYGEDGSDAVRNLQEIISTVESAGSTRFSLAFDPTLVRGMGYYTGPIFEIAVPEFGSSVGGGGRYDEMIGRFTGQNTPACGFSIGFERIISILLDQDRIDTGDEGKTAMLLEKKLSAEKKAEAFRTADKLRAEGKTVLVVTMAKNKKFQKEQLEADGYTDIREVYETPLNR